MINCIVSILFVFFLSPKVSAESTRTFIVDQHLSKVEFLAKGVPGFLRINGKGKDLNGTASVNGKTGRATFNISMEKFVTGIDLRDKHMRDKYLEVAKFPTASVDIPTLDLSKAEGTIPFKGSLNLHGQSKAIEGTVKLGFPDATTLVANASFSISIGDFAISDPGFAGITMARDVNISADLTMHTKGDK